MFLIRYSKLTLNRLLDMKQLKTKIRYIIDFPKAGIVFKDITPRLKDHDSLLLAVKALTFPPIETGLPKPKSKPRWGEFKRPAH